MKRKMSRTKKSLLYALIGSSLFWHTPLVAYAEETPEAPPTTEQATEAKTTDNESASNHREFSFERVEVTANRDKELPPVYAGGQVAREANLGILGNKDFMDTPFNVTSYTAQTIENKQASTLHDVLASDPSVRFTTSSGHIMENFIIRGMDVNADHLYFNGMTGLAPVNHVPVEFLEQVEVLKGPSSFLYGGVNTSVGGTINLVPKRAGAEDITTLTTDYTSQSQWGGHIDIGRRYGQNKELGIRFNGVYKNGNTETDGQSKERILGALGMDYQSGKWRLGLDAYGMEESYDNGTVSMYQLSNGFVSAPDGSTNVLKGTYGISRNNAILFKSEYDLKDNITAYAGIGKLSNTSTGYLTGNHVRSFKANGDGTINIYNQYNWTDSISSELGLRGKYQTGAVNHQVVLASSFLDSESSTTNNAKTGIATNIYHPTSLSSYLSALSTPAKPNKSSTTELSSFLLADTLTFDEDKTQLTLGVRKQNVHAKSFNITTGAQTAKFDENANMPVVGLVVKPWGKSVSLYANYIEVLSPGPTVSATSTYNNKGQMLAPYTSKQQEIGIKWDKGSFANTLAFYQIRKPTELVIANTVTYDGEQKNRGIEWSFFGKLTEHTRLLGGITYMESELVRTTGGVNQGNTPYGIPKWMMNTGIEWDTSWNRDVTLSLNAIYTGSQYANTANDMKLPNWVRYDLGARYKTTIDNVPVTFHASVENVFDKHYWASSFSDNYVTLGSPRTFKLSATWNL